VAEAWRARFDPTLTGGVPGALEGAVAGFLARARAGSLGLPDHYLALDPEGWDPTLRHFVLGWLAAAAPVRVTPVAGTAVAVTRALPSLATGRWWPEPARLLQGLDRVVPDRAGVESGETSRREGAALHLGR
jgi:hypothetical protein